MSISDFTQAIHPAGGTLLTFTHTSSSFIPGSQRIVTVYLPAALQRKEALALEILPDGMPSCEAALLEELIATGVVPPLLAIGVASAKLPPLIPSGAIRSVRSAEYDRLGSGYADFIIGELLPEIAARLPDGYSFSDSPDFHAICGCSSGGICSWNACWERNDFFRRCIIISPTFSSFRGGESYLALIRKYETKPIRCFMTVGTEDMRNSAGDWYLEALTADAAMEYAGYEHQLTVFPKGLHGIGYNEPQCRRAGLAYIWKDWQTKKVAFAHFPERVADIITPENPWRVLPGELPDFENTATPYGCYNCIDGNGVLQRGKICLHQGGQTRLVATMQADISGMALSCDHTRLYVSSRASRFITCFLVAPDGALRAPFPFARLHIKDDASILGATGLCIDNGDRLYVATEMGIQTFSYEGHSNCVLPLPGNIVPNKVCFDLAVPRVLHAVAADGTVYSRNVLTLAPGSTPSEANTARF